MDADLDLLQRFADQGSDQAFSELVLRHAPAIQAACRRRLHDGSDADDAAQAVFLILARKAPALVHQRRGSRPLLGDWLHVTARHVSCNLVRTRARRRRHEREAGQDAGAMVATLIADGPGSADAGDEDLEARLDDAISALPRPLRQAVVLHFLEGHSREHTAQALGISDEALKKRLQRALQGLRRQLGGASLDQNVLTGLAAPAVITHPLVATLASYRAGATIPTHVTNAVTGGLHAMHLVLWKTLAVAALLALSAAAVVGAASLADQPAPLAVPPPAAAPTRGYAMIPGTIIHWASELEWTFAPDPSLSTDPAQFFIPLHMRSLTLWQTRVLPAEHPGAVLLSSSPRYLWEARPANANQVISDPKAPQQHQDPVIESFSTAEQPLELTIALDDQGTHMRTKDIDVLACDYDPLLTYFGLPDLFRPVPMTLEPGADAQLTGPLSGSIHCAADGGSYSYDVKTVVLSFPELYRTTVTFFGMNSEIAVSGKVDQGSGRTTVAWDQARGQPSGCDSTLTIHLIMFAKPAQAAGAQAAGAQAPPVPATMGLVSGTLTLHRVATVLASGQDLATDGYAALGGEFRKQRQEAWQQRLSTCKDGYETALVHGVLQDLHDPAWAPAPVTPAKPKAEF